MLIQITNKCYMECPHCMEDSIPTGKNMSMDVFGNVLEFCRQAAPIVVNVSGGEPTTHPLWKMYVSELLRLPSIKCLNIITNGSWIEDNNIRIDMAKLLRNNKERLIVQVFSHPKYYRMHDWTVAHEKQFRSIGCIADFTSPIFMQDLGRARQNCIAEIGNNTHIPSCINSHLFACQAKDFHRFLEMCSLSGKTCRPLIDINGNVHMSESWLCPSVANISEGIEAVFAKMRLSRPCKGCRLYKNFSQRHAQEEKFLERMQGVSVLRTS